MGGIKESEAIKRLEDGLNIFGWGVEINKSTGVNGHELVEIKVVANRDMPYGEYKKVKGFGNIIIATGDYNSDKRTIPVTLFAGKMYDIKDNLSKHLNDAFAEADAQGCAESKALGYVLNKFGISCRTIKDYAMK